MDDVLAVRTLAERLLSLPRDPDAEAEPVRILVGALPDDLPCAVPIPEGATVIGSVSYPPVQSAYDQRGRRVTILFDTAQTARWTGATPTRACSRCGRSTATAACTWCTSSTAASA